MSESSKNETIGQIIERVWTVNEWKKLPLNYKINLRYNYYRTIQNRRKRGTTINGQHKDR